MKRFKITIFQNTEDMMKLCSNITVTIDAMSASDANAEAVKMDKGFGYDVFELRPQPQQKNVDTMTT